MNLFLRAVPILLLTGAAPAPAAAQTVHEASAASAARVELTKNADGDPVVVMSVRNARLVPYVVYDGDRHVARLATVTTEVKSRTDAEGVDPASTVAVTVEDWSGSEPKRLSQFSDPGAAGEVIGQRYFSATMPGCCDGPQIHRVRDLETGAALFRSTGPDPIGSAAWAEVPNARPAILRWAAFDGDTSEADSKRGLLGTIAYGGGEGSLSSVQVLTKLGEEERADLWEGLAHDASLVWIDPKASKEDGGPPSGEADSPRSIWALEGVSDPNGITGFQLALMLGGKRLASIPIMGDRLDLKGSVVSNKIYLRAPPR